MDVRKRIEKIEKLKRKLAEEKQKLNKQKRTAEAKISILITKAILKKASEDRRLKYVARDILSVLEHQDVEYIIKASALLTEQSWEPLRELVKEIKGVKNVKNMPADGWNLS